MQEKIIRCRWLLCLPRCKAIKRDVSKETYIGRGPSTYLHSTSKDMPTSEPPSSADDDGAALRHDCVFCNSPSASQGPNEREWHTCERKKKVSPPPPPLHHHPKEHGNKAAPKASESTQEREAKAELGALTSHSQPRGPKISVAGGAEGVIAEDIERHKRLGYVPWDPRSRVNPSSNDSNSTPPETSPAQSTPHKSDSDSTSDAVSPPEPDPGSLAAESESTQKQEQEPDDSLRKTTR